jgi:hypothetical protein
VFDIYVRIGSFISSDIRFLSTHNRAIALTHFSLPTNHEESVANQYHRS